jgi:hypothetical protein
LARAGRVHASRTEFAVLTRPYVLVTPGEGCRLGNGGGFGASTTYLPAWRQHGPVLQSVAVPHWFLIASRAPCRPDGCGSGCDT